MIEQVTVNALIVGCGAALLALALSLVRSAAGFFDFALAGNYTFAAYLTYALLSCGSSTAFAIAASILLAVACAVLTHFGLYQPLRRLGATPEVLLIASLSLLLLFQNGLPLVFGDAILSLPGNALRNNAIHLSSRGVTTVECAIVILTAAVTGTLILVLQYTELGLQMRALAQDRELSRIYGVRPQRILFSAVVVSASLAATIGVLNGFDNDLVPTMGFRAVLLAAVAAVVGGGGSIPGVVVGALLVAGAQQLVALSLPVQWQDTIVFSCLIIFVVWRPNGIFGRSVAGIRA